MKHPALSYHLPASRKLYSDPLLLAIPYLVFFTLCLLLTTAAIYLYAANV